MTAISFLALSAAFITPADANWFSSQKHNTMFNIGSIRNPTPQELRFFYAKAEADRQAAEAERQAKANHKN
ncbi:MAG TPA: hypothetical protein VHT51_08390 [Micropepsaceae bacterium]|nr:hypothetical protein [Micropepsaceae bacterium]